MLEFIEIGGNSMKIDQAVKHFGSQARLAETLGITDSAISRWKERGVIIPIKTAIRLYDMTGHELDLHLRDYQ
jgi:plasmid maintenance system antidote protein VapI